MFRPVSSQFNLPQIEEKLLHWWKQNKIFERSVENRKGGPRFTLYEGPPTANGSPGIHHVLSRIFKDIIPRHRAMKGYYTPRIGGWDTHGLPVELEVERELGLSSKTQIEEYGIDKFNARCRESVFRYLKDWDALTERIAYWCDLEHPYVTMENYYIETVWWAIKQMWDRGLVYLGYKTAAHCPRCGTSLSSHEVALGYEDDTEDPSVYIKFKVARWTGREDEVSQRLSQLALSRDTYFLAWTTTPWTLPGNTALAVDADADYAVVEADNGYLILADALREAVGLGDNKVVMKVEGGYLAGAEYEPLFNPHEFGVERRRFQSGAELLPQEPDKDLTYRVIATDFVSMEDGTGIVHVAPAFGEVDFEAGKEQGLDFVQQVDLQGNVTGNYSFSGKFVKDADPLVLEELKEKGLLYRSETIRHTYPFCWRCSTPLLYYVKESWYIKTTAVKDSLISGNNEINWYPEHIKHGRFGDWLENNVDWAFSRERYWGTPVPIWRCKSCDYRECVGGVDDLKGKPGFKGLKEPLDLHRPYVDDMTYDCPQCGGTMRRVPEVIDCWFDSGAMPVAQMHYPFENETLLEDGRFPADYICEAVDQTRGWFYSLHAISTLLFGRPSFLNCICLGHILDAKGEKMSKAKGNVIEPSAVINKYGADALRWYFFTSSPPGNVRRFSADMVSEVTRRFLLTLWNIYSFFVNYANIDQFTPGAKGVLSHSELDHWIISELNQLVADVDSGLENYDPSGAGRKIEAFVYDLSNWYVRRSRRRFWKSENDADKLAAYTTLYQCLVTVSKLLAPFTPFVAEEMYQNLVCPVFPDQPESVHLADFPVADTDKIDQHLAADVRLIMRVSSLGRAARSEAGIKVRQPLSRLIIKVASERQKRALKHLAPQVMEEVNVKALDVVDDMPVIKHKEWPLASEGDVMVMLDTDITPELAAEGMAREIVRRLQMMRRSAGFEIADHIATCYQGDEYIKSVVTGSADYIKQETLSEQLVDGAPEEGAYTESFKLEGHELFVGVKKLS
ncbi:MAG: isoleucine--tRNA ligase [Dehalococcoidales bacterium]